MSYIYFKNITITPKKIEIICESDDESLELNEPLIFELSDEILIDDNQIALTLATLCGQKYDEIYMDLAINEGVYKDIQNFTNSKIEANNIIHEEYFNFLSEQNMMLGFSGGLDSLAAYCLFKESDLFENVYLTSLDLGGRFSREKEFFKRFRPYTVSSNFVDLKLNRNHWSFMFIPQILFSKHLNAKYIVLSGVLEAGVYGLSEKFTLSPNTHSIPASFLNLENLTFIQGLTEIATTIIVMQTRPELIDLSLKSLANPGEEKRYRKQLMVKLMSEKFNKRVYYEPVSEGMKLKWGDYFAIDFLCLYFIKNAGLEETSKIVQEIPEEAINFANSRSLEFYEKYNANFLVKLPEKYRLKYLQRLCQANIYPYNSNDWKEFNEVANFLAKYHENLRKMIE